MRPRATSANVMASLALFVALGGGAYAAATLPRNSVGAAQIKPNAVTSWKVRDNSLLAKDFQAGQLPLNVPGEPSWPDTLPSGKTLTGTFTITGTGTVDNGYEAGSDGIS